MWGLLDEFNDTRLLWLADISPWLLGALAGLALAVLVLGYFDLGDLERKRRIFLVMLRFTSFVAAFCVLMQPALELRHVTVIKNHVAFLVDYSQSMSLPHDSRHSRWEQAQEVIQRSEALLSRPDEQHHFHVFRFAGDLETSSPADILSRSPLGGSTNIMEALEQLSRRYPRGELGGIVLVSDGIDGSTLAGRVRRGEPLDEQTRQFVQSLGVPLHTIPVGQPGVVKDLAVQQVYVDDFAFVRNRVSIEVVIRSTGFDQGLVGVTLRRQGEALQTREIAIQAEQEEYRVQFEFIPQQIGKEIYEVSVPVLAGETLTENNSSFFILNVIRDKVRVLQIAGRPSWDERFLRQFLKSNPNVDLISFFILRTDANLQLVPESELSLIPFPTEEIFDEQLGSFDLVIFQNFSYRPYGMRGYLPGIERYVRDGGALLMIGGDQSFASGGYTGTPIADVLPVLLPPEGPQSALVDETPFRPRLTEAAANHPITLLEFDPDENRRQWDDLPLLTGTNIVLGARPDATVLIEHPERMASGGPLPVLSVMDIERGRSMALTVDSTWRWSFLMAGQGSTHRSYTKFWNSAIRWLIQDPELKLIQVGVPQNHVQPGTSFPVSIRVFQPDYQPAASVAGRWELIEKPLDALGDEARAEVIQGGEFVTDERGRVDMELTVESEGGYELVARVSNLDGGGEVTEGDVFLGLNRTPELADIVPRPDLLQALSTASGAGTLSADDLDPGDLAFAPARTVQINRRRIVDLWNLPWIFLGFAVLLGLEWSLRRRWGHL